MKVDTKTKEALNTVDRRDGNVWEWDHDLMEAAEQLATVVRMTKDIKLPIVNAPDMRRMLEGSVLVFSAGDRTPQGPYYGALRVSCIASRAKMKVFQTTMILTDPATAVSTAVLVVECIKISAPRKPRGKKSTKK